MVGKNGVEKQLPPDQARNFSMFDACGWFGLRLLQFGKVSLEGTETAYNRCIKLPIDRIHMRRGIGDDVCGVTNMMERPDPSDLHRRLARPGERCVWFLKRLAFPLIWDEWRSKGFHQ
jgi:hypothetical protein